MIWHWSVNVKKFKKENPEGFRLWRLEQIINYGLGGRELAKERLKNIGDN